MSRSASVELRKLIDKGAVFKTVLHFKFSDNTEKDIEPEEIYMTGNSFTESAGTSSLPYGCVIAKSLTIKLVNDSEQFSDYDFLSAKISLSVSCTHDGYDEIIPIGKYTVIEPEAYGDSISITAVDDSYKSDFEYSTSLTFPKTLAELLTDSCQTCGVQLGSTSFLNSSYSVQKKPEGITHRQLWGMIAMLAGGNARFDENNKLQIIKYDLSFFTREGLDGGTFLTKTTPYSDGDSADGGNFTDYTSGDVYDGGTFDELNRYHTFYRGQTPTIATDDVVITGVKVTVNSDEYISGDERYALSVENHLVAGDETNGVRLIGDNIINMRFRPFSISNMAYPLAEFGDICYIVDRKDNFYQSIVTDITFNFFGYTDVKCSADNPIRNSADKMTNADSAVKVLRKETEEALSDIEDNIDEIEEDVETIEGELNDATTGIKVRLEKTESDITAEVTRATTAEGTITSRVTVAEGNITAEVSRAEGVEGSLSSRISVTESGIESKVEKNGVISAINQSAESVSINASKVNLTGYITATDLSASGTTVIDGGRIDTDKLVLTDKVQVKYNSTTYNAVNFEVDSEESKPARIRFGNTSIPTRISSATKIYLDQETKATEKVYFAKGAEVNGGTFEFFAASTVKFDTNPQFAGIGSTTNSANVYVGASNRLNQVTSSSERYKHYITDITENDLQPDRLYDLPVRQYIYNSDYIDHNDQRFNEFVPGFIAEDMDKIYPIATEYDQYGRPENWNERYIIPPMIALIQEQHKQIMYLIGELAIIKKNMEETVC